MVALRRVFLIVDVRFEYRIDVIEHLLALRQFLIHQRSGKLRIIHQPFQGIGNFRINIITKESRVDILVGINSFFSFVTIVIPHFLCSRNTLSNFSSCSNVSEEEIITGNSEEFPKKAYLRWLRSIFSSSCGGSSIEGLIHSFFGSSRLSTCGVILKRNGLSR